MTVLETSPLFAALNAAERAVLRAAAQHRQVPAGTEIFREGELGDGLYVIESGRVEVAARVGQQGERVLSRLGAGAVLGEMAVVEDAPRSATATATEETVVWFVPQAVVRELTGRSPALALALVREVSRRLREFDQQHLRELWQAERLALVGRFARAIIHDLKNPLHVISLSAEVAVDKNAGDTARRAALTRIRQQVERITDLVNEVLEFTGDAPKAAALIPTDYGAFVRQVIEELRPEIQLRGVELELDNLPPAVRVRLHPKRLRRVFHNLIQNAADAMTGDGRVGLRFESHPGEVWTAVVDTGPGIAPEIADRLFEPFATCGKAHGTGLGLSICKRTVEEHGGRIWAANAPEGGAVFAFSLPLAEESRGHGISPPQSPSRP